MELFRILTLHLAVFAAVASVVLFCQLAVRAIRVTRLNLEYRQLKTPNRKTPVFAGAHPVLLRMEQGAAGNFPNEHSKKPI